MQTLIIPPLRGKARSDGPGSAPTRVPLLSAFAAAGCDLCGGLGSVPDEGYGVAPCPDCGLPAGVTPHAVLPDFLPREANCRFLDAHAAAVARFARMLTRLQDDGEDVRSVVEDAVLTAPAALLTYHGGLSPRLALLVRGAVAGWRAGVGA